MDTKEYLNALKDTDVRPNEVTVESKEEILLEDAYQSRGEGDLRGQIIKWFLKNPYPNDEQVHSFAEELGVDHEEFEKNIYAILSSILSEGYSKGEERPEFDKKELKDGIEVEYEHTTNPLISKKIAMDHLVEIPDYYTRLAKMEDEAEEYWKNKRMTQTGQ